MAGEREHLRDAVAHEAGADDSDFCVAIQLLSFLGRAAARSDAALIRERDVLSVSNGPGSAARRFALRAPDTLRQPAV